MTGGVMDVMDSLTRIIETCAGYQAAALRAGFSEDAAERMALRLHDNLMNEMERRSEPTWCDEQADA